VIAYQNLNDIVSLWQVNRIEKNMQ